MSSPSFMPWEQKGRAGSELALTLVSSSGSIEERVLALQRRKQAVISAMVSTTDAQVMETLTAADLNELFS